MRRFMHGAALTLAALLALAAPAAAEVWNARGNIADAPADGYAVSVASGGGAAVAWSRTEVKHLGDNNSTVLPAGVNFTSRADAATDFAPPRPLGSDRAGGPVLAVGDDGKVRVAWSDGGDDPTRIDEAVAPLGGEPGPATATDLAWMRFDRAGNAVRVAGGYGEPLKAAFRPAGGSFGAWHELATGLAEPEGVEVLPDGRGVVLWADYDEGSRGVSIAICDAGGCEPRRLSDADHPLGTHAPTLAVGPRGDIAALWEMSGYPGSNQAALAIKPAGEDFEPTRVIEDEFQVDRARAAFDAHGNAFVAWEDGLYVAGRFVPAGGDPGPKEIVPGGFNVDGFDAAFDANDNLVVAMTHEEGSGEEHWLHASERLPDGTWVNPQTVASLPTEGNAWAQEAPRLALDGQGTGLVLWRTMPAKELIEADYDATELTGAPRVTAASAGVAKKRRVRVRYKLSRRSRVVIALARVKCSQVKGRRICRPGATLARVSLVAHRGRNKRLLRLRRPRLASGRYQATVTARRHSVRIARGARFGVR
jgi:hypothetical protein